LKNATSNRGTVRWGQTLPGLTPPGLTLPGLTPPGLTPASSTRRGNLVRRRPCLQNRMSLKLTNSHP